MHVFVASGYCGNQICPPARSRSSRARIMRAQNVVFGELVRGMEIVKEIEKLETDKNEKPLQEVKIIECGEVRLDYTQEYSIIRQEPFN